MTIDAQKLIDSTGVDFGVAQTNNAIHTVSTDATGIPNSIQNPLHVASDSLYASDIWLEESDIGNFSGVVTDLFDNLHTVISNTTSESPKTLIVHFNRTLPTMVIGIGAYTGNFSNLKISAIVSGDVEIVIYDDSSDDTKHTSQTIYTPTIGFNAVKLEFYTTDVVSLSNLFILKALTGAMRIQGQKPDDTFTEFQATTGGNFKISLEELENTISDDTNSSLRVSPYLMDEFANIARVQGDNIFRGAVVTISPDHHEIHCGDSFTSVYTGDLANGASITFAVVIPNEGLTETEEGADQTTAQYHVVFYVDSEGEALITGYEAATLSDIGTSIPVLNRNRNSSRTTTVGISHTPTVTDSGTQVYVRRIGSGRSIGGEAGRGKEFIFRDNTTYLITIANETATNNYFNFEVNYYVHPGI